MTDAPIVIVWPIRKGSVLEVLRCTDIDSGLVGPMPLEKDMLSGVRCMAASNLELHVIRPEHNGVVVCCCFYRK